MSSGAPAVRRKNDSSRISVDAALSMPRTLAPEIGRGDEVDGVRIPRQKFGRPETLIDVADHVRRSVWLERCGKTLFDLPATADQHSFGAGDQLV